MQSVTDQSMLLNRHVIVDFFFYFPLFFDNYNSVLVAENKQVIGPASREYHRVCLTCTDCKKTLDAKHLADHEGDVR